jgi:hypothetical protein
MSLQQAIETIAGKSNIGQVSVKVAKVVGTDSLISVGFFSFYRRVTVDVYDPNGAVHHIVGVPCPDGYKPVLGDYCVVAMIGGGSTSNEFTGPGSNEVDNSKTNHLSGSCIILAKFMPEQKDVPVQQVTPAKPPAAKTAPPVTG